MTRTATPSERPWAGSIIPGSPVRSAVVREVVEMLNYALTSSRAVQFHAELATDVTTTLDVTEALYTVDWPAADRDADAQAYYLTVWGTGGGANFVRLEVSDDGGSTWNNSTDFNGSSSPGTLTWSPSGSPDGLLRIRIRGRGAGTSTVTITRIHMREADLAATDIPTADE